MPSAISDLRKDYLLNGLDKSDVMPNPVEQFRAWFEAAVEAGVPEPNAMHVSTVSADGRPDGRIVLIKDVSKEDLCFIPTTKAVKAANSPSGRWPH
jgi:pyridoxamine 5'-phosphate oxidase